MDKFFNGNMRLLRLAYFEVFDSNAAVFLNLDTKTLVVGKQCEFSGNEVSWCYGNYFDEDNGKVFNMAVKIANSWVMRENSWEKC